MQPVSLSDVDISGLLERSRGGDPLAKQELWEGLYRELRARASHALARRPYPGLTVHPTALVHEVWLRLERAGPGGFEGREHFLATISRIMRQVTVDAVRARRAGHRDRNSLSINLEELAGELQERAVDLEALDGVLTALAEMDPEGAQLVELRFFGGATMEEAARVLGLTRRTAERRWSALRAWLATQLRRGGGEG